MLSQRVRKMGNPIRLLDLLKSCDIMENSKCRSVGLALRNVDRNTPLPTQHCERAGDGARTQIPIVTNVDNVAIRESVVKAVQTLGYDYPPPVKRPSTGNSSAS